MFIDGFPGDFESETVTGKIANPVRVGRSGRESPNTAVFSVLNGDANPPGDLSTPDGDRGPPMFDRVEDDVLECGSEGRTIPSNEQVGTDPVKPYLGPLQPGMCGPPPDASISHEPGREELALPLGAGSPVHLPVEVPQGVDRLADRLGADWLWESSPQRSSRARDRLQFGEQQGHRLQGTPQLMQGPIQGDPAARTGHSVANQERRSRDRSNYRDHGLDRNIVHGSTNR